MKARGKIKGKAPSVQASWGTICLVILSAAAAIAANFMQEYRTTFVQIARVILEIATQSP